MSREFVITTSMHGPGSTRSKGFQGSATRAMLWNEIYRIGSPYLLHKKIATNPKLLEARFQSFGIGIEEPFHNNVILDYHILTGV
jgi:hypothetical protein